MEPLVAAALINAAVLYALHLTLYRRVWAWLFGVLVPALAGLLLYPWVVEQSVASLRALLDSREPVLTLAALLAADALAGLVGAAGRLRTRFGLATGRSWRLLAHLPGIGVLPAAALAQVVAFHVISGRDFRLVALGCAALVFAALSLLSGLLTLAVREWELRLELRLCLLLVQLGVAVAISILVTHLPVTATLVHFELRTLATLCAAGTLLAGAGWLRYRFTLHRTK